MTEERLRHDGTPVVITGAGHGLGRSYALELASAGARVVVNDVDREAAEAVVAEVGAAGGTAVASAHSVADPAACRELVDLCVSEFGSIQALVNNAGIEYVFPSELDDPERQRELITINVLGHMWCGTVALRYMLAQGSGSIVNTVSGADHGVAQLTAYGTSKAALSGLTYAWAVETRDRGVRVNAIAPVAQTRMSRSEGNNDSELVAPLISWLVHPRSAGVTGQVVRFTGTGLGLMTPSHVDMPMVYADRFTTESIEAIFETDLGKRLQPFGWSALVADL